MGKLPKSVGWSLGTELRESHYVLSAKNSTKVQKDMIFHVCLGGPPWPSLAFFAVLRLLSQTQTPQHCLGQQAGCKESAEQAHSIAESVLAAAWSAFMGRTLLSCNAGASDLERSDPGEGQAAKYAILLADTYLVGDGPPAQLTNACPRSWSDAAYFFKVRL